MEWTFLAVACAGGNQAGGRGAPRHIDGNPTQEGQAYSCLSRNARPHSIPTKNHYHHTNTTRFIYLIHRPCYANLATFTSNNRPMHAYAHAVPQLRVGRYAPNTGALTHGYGFLLLCRHTLSSSTRYKLNPNSPIISLPPRWEEEEEKRRKKNPQAPLRLRHNPTAESCKVLTRLEIKRAPQTTKPKFPCATLLALKYLRISSNKRDEKEKKKKKLRKEMCIPCA